jgi:flagellar basal-body rod modification protein FlgD
MNTMSIGAKSAVADPTSTLPTAGSSVATKENFLQLLVAQIKNQNPLQPADGTQFLSQLSQFTEMEQMLGMRDDLKAIRASLTSAASETPSSQS